MNQRGVSTVGAIFLATVAGLAAAVALSDWVVVDVKVPSDDVRVIVPFPLFAARAATAFIPAEAFEDATIPDEVRQARPQVMQALRALHDAPDATLVRVNAPDAKVTVTKHGDDLDIAVDADDATVRCSIPIDGVIDALERWDWKTVDPNLAFRVLSKAGFGRLVTVEAKDGTRVVITTW